MEIIKLKITNRGESYIIPFPDLLNGEGFHISLHKPEYGMHFKLANGETRKQSNRITYNELYEEIKNGGINFIRNFIKKPEQHHKYYVFMVNINEHLDKNTNFTKFGLYFDNPKIGMVKNFDDTFFMPHDYVKLSKYYDIRKMVSYVPDTNEIVLFIGINKKYYANIKKISNDSFTDEEIFALGGVFITFKIGQYGEMSNLLMASFPKLYGTISEFMEEIGNIMVVDYNAFDYFMSDCYSNLPKRF